MVCFFLISFFCIGVAVATAIDFSSHGLWCTIYNNTALAGTAPLINETAESLSAAVAMMRPFQSMTVQGGLLPPKQKDQNSDTAASSSDWFLFSLEGDAGYVRLWIDHHLMLDTNLSESNQGTAQYAIPVPFLPETTTTTMATSRFRLELTTHRVVPTVFNLLANDTIVANDFFVALVPLPERQYWTERNEAEHGWNTWLSADMLTHALLPHGVAVSLELCSSKNHTCVSNLASPNCDPHVFPVKHGLHDTRGHYTELEHVIVENAMIRVETATAGPLDNVLVILITTLTNPANSSLFGNARLSVPNVFAPRTCSISSHDDTHGSVSMVASCPGLSSVELHGVGETILSPEAPNTATFALGDGSSNQQHQVAFVASSDSEIPTLTMKDCIEIVAAARSRLVSRFQQFGRSNETVAGMVTAISWNVIYTPYEGIITPVFRGSRWKVSQPHDYVLFEWDTYLASLMAALVDPWVAKNNVIRMTQSLNYQGFVAGLWNGQCGEIDKTKPPVAGLALEYLLKDPGSLWVAELLLPQLLLWNRWFVTNRRISMGTNNTGLIAPGSTRQNMDLVITCDCVKDQPPVFASKCETGLDNSPLYDHASFVSSLNILDQVDVGMTSLYIRECQTFADVSQMLGHDDFAAEFATRARLDGEELNTHLWNNDAGIYSNKQWMTRDWIEPLEFAPTSFYPMLAHVPSDSQVHRMVLRYLVNSTEFAVNEKQKYGMPSISRSSSAPTGTGYWRGRSWGPMNVLVYLGLKEYAHVPIVQTARNNLAAQSESTFLVEWVNNHRVMENSNSNNGLGCDVENAVPFYHWGALNALIAIMEGGLEDQVKNVFVGNEPSPVKAAEQE